MATMNSHRNAWSNDDPRKLFARGDSHQVKARGPFSGRLRPASYELQNSKKVSSYRPRSSNFMSPYSGKGNAMCITIGSGAGGNANGGAAGTIYDSTAGMKVKTEMCNTVRQGKICHFGDRCKYAHHESELQMTTMRERVEAGQILDGKIYRSRPCFDFTSTGSCPFGSRCAAIHDERLKGQYSAWIKHCRYYQESVPTEVHVDYSCYGKTSEIHYGDSLGAQTQDMFKSFESFSQYVSNKSAQALLFGDAATNRWKQSLTLSQRLHIACKMSENCAEAKSDFKYKPSHIVCGNVCMIVQEKAFRKVEGSYLMEEVSMPRTAHYRVQRSLASSPQIYVVREIVFGHPSSTDDAQHPPALWINTPEDVIFKADLATIKKSSKNKEKGKERCLMRKHEESPFRLFYSSNPEVQKLIGDVLRHQFRLSLFHGNDILNVETRDLESKFTALVKVLKASHWPVNKGRNVDDLDIPLPPVNGQYCVEIATKNDRHLGGLWDSVISNVGNDKDIPSKNTERSNRLSIFRDLGGGFSTSTLSPKAKHIPPMVSISEEEDSKEPLPKDIVQGWEIVKDLWQQGHKGIRLDKK